MSKFADPVSPSEPTVGSTLGGPSSAASSSSSSPSSPSALPSSASASASASSGPSSITPLASSLTSSGLTSFGLASSGEGDGTGLRTAVISSDSAVIAGIARMGGVIAYPTEAVFGLGCRAADAAACERILALKGREMLKGLIVITDDLARVAYWLEPIPDACRLRAEASWPGPHTWLWPARASCPPWLRGSHTRLAVRVSAHPEVRKLCAAAGSALVSTSANRSGDLPCRDSACVSAQFPTGLDGILDQPCAGASEPSTIRDILTGVWLRGGPEHGR